ncbi:MAG: hypothetical protein V1816_07745 [Pseudomonadota bacterium]
MWKRALPVVLGILLLCAVGTANAQGDLSKESLADYKTKEHLTRKNAIALKIGPHIYSGSNYLNYWEKKPTDLSVLTFEVGYERNIVSFLGVELAGGYFHTKMKKTSTIYLGDHVKSDISTYYFSPSLKGTFNLTTHLAIYGGVGPDLFIAEAKQKYSSNATLNVTAKEQKIIPGAHALAGVEYYIFLHPAEHGFFDAPTGVFVEYKYTYANWKDLDKDVMKKVGSNSKHDFNLGGHFIFMGLRFHF